MEKYIYRYINLETFIDMLLNQRLVFVHPTKWEDPMELDAYNKVLKHRSLDKNSALTVAYFAAKNKTYCQSWTELSESDAMWRIYSYDNKSIQIRVKLSSIRQLPISVNKVVYTDSIEEYIKTIPNEKMDQLFAIKRNAYKHEKEIRLVSRYLYKGSEDLEKHVIAAYKVSDSKWIQNKTEAEWKIELDECIKLLNADLGVLTKIIDFSMISDFIDSVVIHPQAQNWYVNIVGQLCNIHNIKYKGKSKLYEIADDL